MCHFKLLLFFIHHILFSYAFHNRCIASEEGTGYYRPLLCHFFAFLQLDKTMVTIKWHCMEKAAWIFC